MTKRLYTYPNICKFLIDEIYDDELGKIYSYVRDQAIHFYITMEEGDGQSLEENAKLAILDISPFPLYFEMGTNKVIEYIEDLITELISKAIAAYKADRKLYIFT